MGWRRTGVPRTLLLLGLVVLAGCRAGGCVVASFADLVGETDDVACDRRYVTEEGSPSAFCQEIIDTIAMPQIWDDCRQRHHARAIEGRCPRERIVAGCKVSRVNDDGSQVYDWYYDVEEEDDESGLPYESRVTSADEVRAKCADRTRYESGAEFVEP